MYKKYKASLKAGEMGCGSSQIHDSKHNEDKDPVSKECTSNGADPKATNADPGSKSPATDPGSPSKDVEGSADSITTTQTVTDPKKPKRTPEEEKKHKEFVEAEMKKLDDLMKMAGETEAMLLKALAKNMGGQLVMDAVKGNIDTKCPSPAKIVRIFTSSTFTDTKQERNMLMKYGYPKIKEHCRKIGYEFQVVDMRWGVRDEATDDHMGTELCLKELKLCQQLSTGPNFVSLLSHKYGYTAFPRLIDAVEFEKIFNSIQEQDIKDLFQKWYTRDDNFVSPTYTLASISTHLPDFICNDPDKKKVAKNQWWNECQKMQDTLEAIAKIVFDDETARKYIMSVTETEVQEGILKVSDINNNKCLWLKRNIEDIEKQESNYALSRFMECLGSEEKVMKARTMLKELKEDKMMRKLDSKKILNYNVLWSPNGGIDPDSKHEHHVYLETLCEDFVNHMIDMIDKSVAKKKQVENPLTDECLQHIRFAQTKVEGFAGREETLNKLKAYLTNNTKGKPLVLYGSSGTGKTSIMAMAAKLARTWMSKKAIVVVRFLGTSPDSSNLISLLYSMSSQIRKACGAPPSTRFQKIEQQILDFKGALIKVRPHEPLVIILDSLDQLDPAYDARKLLWLNFILPPSIKIIVSTLPELEYECFPALKEFIKEEDKYIDVPVLLDEDAKTILNNWLQTRGRKLTDHQMNVVLQAFEKCPTPLFLKLSFEESTSWTSYLPPDKSILQDTVRASIDHLFQKLEKLHGRILLSRSLAYLTLANNGATEAELEDILSCDNDVLNDVYMYWTPPIRRLPPLLLVRIRTDLDQYLVERGADGVRVLYWYHRQFTEAALARYCSDAEDNRLRHAHLADFFNGTWAGRKKPYVTAKGERQEEDRHVSAQPLKFGDKEYNIRSLNNLPYHRIHADQGDLLQEQCLGNVNFLQRKLEALPLLSVLDDFPLARAIFKNNPLIGRIHDALLLSQKGLITDPRQVIPQMLGRLDEDDVTKDFLAQCRSYGITFIEPSHSVLDKPGGQLVHCISAHKSDIDMMDMSTNGRYALTVCQADHEIKIWDVQTAQLKRSVANAGQCDIAYFCMNDKCIVYIQNKAKTAVFEEVETGIKSLVIPVKNPDKVAMCVAGKDKSLFLLFGSQVCAVFNLNDKTPKAQFIINKEKVKFGPMSISHGRENYVAVCSDDQYFITVLDLRTMTFKKKFRGFKEIVTEDGDTDEHEVEALAIDPGEQFLVYTTLFTSEVVFADFEGNRLRNIPANEDRSFRSLNFSPDGQFFFLHDRTNLTFFDTNTLEEMDSLEHNKDVINGRTVDMRTIVTVADDSNLRIWDRTRPKLTESNSTSDINRIGTIKRMSDLAATKYVLVKGEDEGDDKHCKLGVFDVFQQKYVRMKTIENIDRLYPVDATRVLTLVEGRKPYIINIDTMKLIELTGSFPKHQKDFAFVEPNKLVSLSLGQKNLKVYDITTGKVLYFLKAGQNQNIDSFVVNRTGTVACAQTDEGPLILYDMVNKKHMYNIDASTYGDFFGYHKWINDEGTRLVFNFDKPLPGMGAKADDVDHCAMWDIERREELFRMYDLDYYKKYAAAKSEESTSMDSVESLDENRLIMTSYDNILRIYDVHTGKLLNRLEGHTTSVQLKLDSKSPYILSYGSTFEEDCIRLWDKESGKQIASYSLDKTTNELHWISGSDYFVSMNTGSQAKLTCWRIHHGQAPASNDIPDLFKPIAETDEPLKPKVPKMDGKKVADDPDDPDSDPEVVSSDEEDDEDDDQTEI